MEACFMHPIVKNSGQKGQCRRLYTFSCWFNKIITCSVQNSIPNINVHGRQKASTVRLLVPVTSLHSVCGLYTVRHNGTNSLSFSAAAPLLYLALHWCHWEHLAQSSSFFLNSLFFTHAPMLGSTLFHRSSKGNYMKLQKPFFRSTLYLYKEA